METSHNTRLDINYQQVYTHYLVSCLKKEFLMSLFMSGRKLFKAVIYILAFVRTPLHKCSHLSWTLFLNEVFTILLLLEWMLPSQFYMSC